ncbi:hypothetical protein ABW20_dc0109825 [Dactylellina cionopaga]|nr:hypothetical protein ABW20_dc0109825 [Dactylellina cionopaga]
MQFSTVAIVALAALPSLISGFSLYDVSSDLGDANSKCASQYSIPLMSCGFLPGPCSNACQEQLQSLQTTLQNVCKDSKDPQNLLLSALNNGLVGALCKNANGGSQPSRVASPTSAPAFISGPGKSAIPSSVVQLTFSSVANAEPSVTGLVIDTSTPETPATQTVAFPENTYAPTTLRTSSSSPSTTSGSSSNSGNSNGSPFASQDDNTNSAGSVRAGVLGLAVGVIALIVNIA